MRRRPSRRTQAWLAAALVTSGAVWAGATSAQAALGPAQQVTSGTVVGGSLAVSASAHGRSTYVWNENRLKLRVQASDGTFGAIHNLTTAFAQQPVVATASDGRAFVMWGVQNGSGASDVAFFVRVVNPNGTMTKAVRLVPDKRNHQYGPSIALTPQGSARVTVAGAYGFQPAYRGVLTRTISKAGRLGPVVRLSKGSGSEATQVAIAPSGAGIVTWQHTQKVQAKRFSAKGRFGTLLNLGTRSIVSASPPPALAISAQGVATVTWVHAATTAADSVVKVQARRVLVNGTRRPLLTLASVDNRFGDLHVATGTDGGSTIAWTRITHTYATSAQVRRINTHDALGATHTLSQPTDVAFALGIVPASSGDVLVLWQVRSGAYPAYVQRVSPNGSLDAPVVLTAPAEPANYLAIASSPQGRATVLWANVGQQLLARRGAF